MKLTAKIIDAKTGDYETYELDTSSAHYDADIGQLLTDLKLGYIEEIKILRGE